MRVFLIGALLMCASVAQAQTHRIAVFVVLFQDSPPSPFPWSSMVAGPESQAAIVDAYWPENSYGQFTTKSDVFGVYVLPLNTVEFCSPITPHIAGGYGDATCL